MFGYVIFILVFAVYFRHVQLRFSSVPPRTIYAFNNTYILLNWRIESNDLLNRPYIKWSYKSNLIVGLQTLDGSIVRNYNNGSVFARRFSLYGDQNETMPSINSSVITLGPLNTDDDGEIKCDVSLISESYVDSINLVILAKPSFNDVINNTIVNVNEMAYIYFTITSKPQANVTWFVNGTEIYSSNRYFMSAQKNSLNTKHTLLIKNMSILDSGLYTCLASIRIAQIYVESNQSLKLIVNYPPYITYIPQQFQAVIDDTAKLRCQARGSPTPEIKWFRNNFLMINNNSYRITTEIEYKEYDSVAESVFTIDSVKIDDFGTYTCQVENILSGFVNRTTELVMRRDLSFLNQNLSEVMVGNSITLNCTVQAYPKPSVNWIIGSLNNNRTTISSPKVLVETLDNVIVEILLTISNTTLDDNNVYNCVANNSDGILTANTTLYVKSVTTSPPLLPPASFQAPGSWHKEWYIVIWVFIPIVCVLLIILAILLARRRRNNKAVIVVPVNRSIPDPPVRSMATQRDIYLPQANQLQAVNLGYTPDTDVQEIEVEFNEDSSVYLESVEYNPNAGNAFYNHYDQAGPAPKNKPPEVQVDQQAAGYAVINDKVKLFDRKSNFNVI